MVVEVVDEVVVEVVVDEVVEDEVVDTDVVDIVTLVMLVAESCSSRPNHACVPLERAGPKLALPSLASVTAKVTLFVS